MNIWNCMNAKQGDAKPGRARSAEKSSRRKTARRMKLPTVRFGHSGALGAGNYLLFHRPAKAPRSSAASPAHVTGGLGVFVPLRGRRRDNGGKSTASCCAAGGGAIKSSRVEFIRASTKMKPSWQHASQRLALF